MELKHQCSPGKKIMDLLESLDYLSNRNLKASYFSYFLDLKPDFKMSVSYYTDPLTQGDGTYLVQTMDMDNEKNNRRRFSRYCDLKRFLEDTSKTLFIGRDVTFFDVNEYLRARYSAAAPQEYPVFPKAIFTDGYCMSIQASRLHYCTPRKNFAFPYTSVELGYPNRDEPLLDDYREGDIYPSVPVEVVNEVIKKHGGILLEAPKTEADTAKCDHSWVRDKDCALLLSNPPQAWYVCEKCGGGKEKRNSCEIDSCRKNREGYYA